MAGGTGTRPQQKGMAGGWCWGVNGGTKEASSFTSWTSAANERGVRDAEAFIAPFK